MRMLVVVLVVIAGCKSKPSDKDEGPPPPTPTITKVFGDTLKALCQDAGAMTMDNATYVVETRCSLKSGPSLVVRAAAEIDGDAVSFGRYLDSVVVTGPAEQFNAMVADGVALAEQLVAEDKRSELQAVRRLATAKAGRWRIGGVSLAIAAPAAGERDWTLSILPVTAPRTE